MGLKEWLFGEKKAQEELREEWTVVGYVDSTYVVKSLATREEHDASARSVLKISNTGRRKVSYNFGEVMQGLNAARAAQFWGHKIPMQLKAWAAGGPLPDNFMIMKDDTVDNERRPNKVPEALRRPYKGE